MRYLRFLTATFVLVGALLVAIPASFASSAKIDTYNYDGYSYRACSRDHSGSQTTYTCRDIGLGPVVSYWSNQETYTHVAAGNISGGSSDVDIDRGAGILEGCDLYLGYDVCGSYSINPRTKTYNSGPSFYWMAFTKWLTNQYTAYTCLDAMYHVDAYDVSTSCQ